MLWTVTWLLGCRYTIVLDDVPGGNEAWPAAVDDTSHKKVAAVAPAFRMRLSKQTLPGDAGWQWLGCCVVETSAIADPAVGRTAIETTSATAVRIRTTRTPTEIWYLADGRSDTSIWPERTLERRTYAGRLVTRGVAQPG